MAGVLKLPSLPTSTPRPIPFVATLQIAALSTSVKGCTSCKHETVAEGDAVLLSAIDKMRLCAVNHAAHRALHGDPGCPCALSLHELLRGSAGFAVAPPVLPPPSEACLQRRKELTAMLAEKEYQRLTRHVDPNQSSPSKVEILAVCADKLTATAILTTVKEIQKQLSLGLNLFLTFIACFLFGYYATQFAYPDLVTRVLFGILCAVVASIAELWLMIRPSL